ncbi:phage integrase [Thalassospira profundimaris WP0211]|nr:phage integrase [Thalassospira profundimaris WP0211]
MHRLQMVLNSPVFSEGFRPLGGAGEAAFWVPLVCMFTGARLTEVCGLEIADIGCEMGIDYFFKGRNLDKAFAQLQQYAGALGNPSAATLARAKFRVLRLKRSSDWGIRFLRSAGTRIRK